MDIRYGWKRRCNLLAQNTHTMTWKTIINSFKMPLKPAGKCYYCQEVTDEQAWIDREHRFSHNCCLENELRKRDQQREQFQKDRAMIHLIKTAIRELEKEKIAEQRQD